MNLSRRLQGGDGMPGGAAEPTILEGVVDIPGLLQQVDITMHSGQLKDATEIIAHAMGLTVGKTILGLFLTDDPTIFPDTDRANRILQIDELLDRHLPPELITESERCIERERSTLGHSNHLLNKSKDQEKADPDRELAIQRGIEEIESFVTSCFTPERLDQIKNKLINTDCT